MRLIGAKGGVIEDSGYRDPKCITKSTIPVSCDSQHIHQSARTRHENANESLKIFHILKHVYRHQFNRHRNMCFAVFKILELMF